MTGDVLKRLIDTERRAEAIVEDAQAEQKRLVEEARHDARALEERFEARVPEIHALQLKNAERRAGQTIANLERQFEARRKELRRLVDEHEEDALRAALALLTRTDSGE